MLMEAERRIGERDAAFLDFLERRRSSLADAMWQAPGLTVAAQAFLLQVLTDPSISDATRLAILFAGLAAVLASTASLLRLRVREVQFSEAFANRSAAIGLSDVRPDALPAPSRGRGLDRFARWLGTSWPFRHVYLFWIIALHRVLRRRHHRLRLRVKLPRRDQCSWPSANGRRGSEP